MDTRSSFPGPRERLESLLKQPGNRFCADCGSAEPKWVSLNIGVFICIKCAGVHRSLGVHISKVLSVNLDGWNDEQVQCLADGGGNTAVNIRYEAFLPEGFKKLTSTSPTEERVEFIRRKYELQEFLNSNIHPINSSKTDSLAFLPEEKKHYEKQKTGKHLFGFRHALRNSWRKRNLEHKGHKSEKQNSENGMVEFVGLLKVNTIKGKHLAVRDILTSDPYVILTMGNQSTRTQVINSSLNPIWNERLILGYSRFYSVTQTGKFVFHKEVFDKDTFKSDDRMGEAEIDIQPLVAAAKACENNTALSGTMQLGKWMASEDNTLLKDSIISLVDGKIMQDISLRLRNVERGDLEIELECVSLSQ